MANPKDYETLVLFAEQVYYSSLYAVFIWDWFICGWREYSLFWRSSSYRDWSLSKIIYIGCRYWPLISTPVAIWAYTSDLSVNMCERVYRIPVLFAVFNQFFAQAALAWNTHRILASTNSMLVWVFLSLAGITGMQVDLVMQYITLRPFVAPPMGACLPIVTSRSFLGYFLGPFLYTTYLTVWATLHVVRMAYSAHAVAVASADHSGKPARSLLKSFYTIAVTEGLPAHALVMVVYLSAVIVFARFDADDPHWMHMSFFQAPLVYMFPGICACNLILHQTKRTQSRLRSSSSSFFYSAGAGTSRSRSIAFARPVSTYSVAAKVQTVDMEKGIVTGENGREVHFDLASGVQAKADTDADATSGQIGFAPPEEEEREVKVEVERRLV
ncbi:hypothetical protein EXIGLDRAFT_761774 [Exidia glandulosa HHB12029]|uniref:DUF6533 domain-containing protein n=1 Tax=Exidia glandulosa HHB12029 TaxID=1314781 RepID=A0A165N9S7_EXIGL|nr:hypothetical protein EXIGLDRAFT_761774 [Exidia glandulosa HHB12029]